MGPSAGNSYQNAYSVAIGANAGQFGQYTSSVAIGPSAGQSNQKAYAVAIGNQAGQTAQKDLAIAIGHQAGLTSQGESAVAIGQGAGSVNQGFRSVAIGYLVGYLNAIGSNAVAIGTTDVACGANSVAIGQFASASTAGSIVLNASGTAITSTQAGFYVSPIRVSTSSGKILATVSGEIVDTGVTVNSGNLSGLTTVTTSSHITNGTITMKDQYILGAGATTKTSNNYGFYTNGSTETILNTGRSGSIQFRFNEVIKLSCNMNGALSLFGSDPRYTIYDQVAGVNYWSTLVYNSLFYWQYNSTTNYMILDNVGNLSLEGLGSYFYCANNGGGGVAAPTSGPTPSGGTKFIFYRDGVNTPYSLGIDSGTLWYSSQGVHRWYNKSTEYMSIDSTGLLTLPYSSLGGTGIQLGDRNGVAAYNSSWFMYNNVYNGGLGNRSSYLRFYNTAAASDRLIIDKNGSLGLGGLLPNSAGVVLLAGGLLPAVICINGSSAGEVAAQTISCPDGALTINAGRNAVIFHVGAVPKAFINTGSISGYSDNTMSAGQSGQRYTTIYLVSAPIVSSDSREKTDIVPSALGLDFINKLKPVSYKRKVGQNTQDAEGKLIPRAGLRTHYGLIAQEVKETLDEFNVGDFGGWVLTDLNNPESPQGLSYSQFISPMIKAIQELTAKNTDLEIKVVTLEERIARLESLIIENKVSTL